MLRVLLLLAFFLSGAAGLIYEVVWSRYLALFLGHSAEAQVLVIAMFLGGMSLGALVVGVRSRRLEHPLTWYAAAEAALCAFGLTFHFLFGLVTDAAYGSIFPALGNAAAITMVKWAIAGLLVFVPAVVLGTTFPLIAVGTLRRFPSRPGGTIAALYFVNSLGGALAVLVAGFVLIAIAGLRGALVAAAALNLGAAILAAVIAARASGTAPHPTPEPVAATRSTPPPSEQSTGVDRTRRRLWVALLWVSALTAVASFIYEIGWIRMLSLVMGSATHSFEIMLSAFILGLAIGALAIRGEADRAGRPIRLLGSIQWLMGLAALATLPVYVASFDLLGGLVAALPATDQGYQTYNLARYGVALAVMLPSTVLAGMTLPLITSTLLRIGSGERAIGWVYACNTAGAIVGVILAGLVLIPWLGLKGMLVAGAAVDMALGVALLAIDRGRGIARAIQPVRTDSDDASTGGGGSPGGSPTREWVVPAAAVAAILVCVLAATGLRFDRALLTSGVFRYGSVDPTSQPILYYADGRTATVGVHISGSDTLIVLTSNGKPDASLTSRWVRAARERLPVEPITQQDEATQMLTSLVTLAYAPDVRTGAVIGHGSGMSGHFLLSDPDLESLTTIEIEPRMIDASYVYYPANGRVFDDPRSRMVIADAKSFFAGRGERFDLILSEPSNPWVSGTASLFSLEFYQRIRSYLSEDGVFAQWFHLYESDADLVLSVISALHASFPDYRAYLVGDTDLMVVATAAETLRDPDWSLLLEPDLRAELDHFPPLRPHHLEGLQMFGRAELEPLADGWESPNSDYRPVLDLGAERARFLDSFADGVYQLARDRFRLAAALGGWRLDPATTSEMPIPGLAPVRGRAIAREVRRALSDPEAVLSPWAEVPGRAVQRGLARMGQPPDSASDSSDWGRWLGDFVLVERALHSGTAGFIDTEFYRTVHGILETADPPVEVLAAVEFMEGLASWDFEAAASGARVILAAVNLGDGPAAGPGSSILAPLDRGLLLDGAAVAFLKTGDPAAAEGVLRDLEGVSGRAPGDFRLRLLRAHIELAQATARDTTTTADALQPRTEALEPSGGYGMGRGSR
jgi:predicted membrane-bound spermidine synthase